mmetsp:Transcript_19221/g.36813  ORF Transcript_19221/g.36813 Transcript_19221/m.36813 type:complete len:231 (+) Transcript_19221:161-853(+)
MGVIDATQDQRRLWTSNESSEWEAALGRYRLKLPAIILGRSPPHMNHEELVRVMEWKLTRGKMRPLMNVVRRNEASSVESTSKLSFKSICNKAAPPTKAAAHESLKTITELKGIGPATGSAILALVCPSEFPFMSDEVMAVALSPTTSSKMYSMERYFELKTALQAKAKAINQAASGSSSADWTPSDVERAVWATAYASCATSPAPSNKRKDIGSDKSSVAKRDPAKRAK